MPSAIKVFFQHWKYEITSNFLTRYGSPFFSRADAGQAVRGDMLRSAQKLTETDFTFDPHHIICANEAFPEAAIADPLADLQVWDEWASGYRVFPYPGFFSRLGITQQEGKTSSPSSVGVLGEILTGLFAQAHIGPQVLVRVIRHWPDFIFFVGNDIYAFVESKAFTNARWSALLNERIPDAVTRELLCDAVAQLNADPHLDIWACFTGVVSINPQLELTVTMIQITPPAERRSKSPRKILPQAVVKGLAQRAVSQAALKLSPDEVEAFDVTPSKGLESSRNLGRARTGLSRNKVEALLIKLALDELAGLFGGAQETEATAASYDDVATEIQKLARSYQLNDTLIGKRFFELKHLGLPSYLQKIRQSGADFIFMANIPKEELAKIDQGWTSNWANVTVPFGRLQNKPIWRFGGAVYCCGPESLDEKLPFVGNTEIRL